MEAAGNKCVDVKVLKKYLRPSMDFMPLRQLPKPNRSESDKEEELPYCIMKERDLREIIRRKRYGNLC